MDDSFPKSDQAFDGPVLTCVGSAILELLLLVVLVLELDHGFGEVSMKDVLPSNVVLLLCGAGQGRITCCHWGPGRVMHGLKHRCVQKVSHVVIAFHFVVQCHEVQLCGGANLVLFSVAESWEVCVVFTVTLAQQAMLGTCVLCLMVSAFSSWQPSHVELGQDLLVSQQEGCQCFVVDVPVDVMECGSGPVELLFEVGQLMFQSCCFPQFIGCMASNCFGCDVQVVMCLL